MNDNNDYLSKTRGKFVGLMQWQDLSDFWDQLLQQADGWYVYAIGDAPPKQPLNSQQLNHFVLEIDQLLHKEHQEEYCGIVYTDDRQSPTMVKIYDPNNLGVVCGFSDNPPLPGWIISRLQPVDLQALQMTGSRKRWWQKLFS